MPNVVYALALIAYSSIGHNVSDAPIKSFHISNSDCIQEKTYQNKRGVKETYNRKYYCMRVEDAEMYAVLRQSHGRTGVDSNGYRSGTRIIIQIN